MQQSPKAVYSPKSNQVVPEPSDRNPPLPPVTSTSTATAANRFISIKLTHPAVSVEDADDAAVRGINQTAAANSAASDAPDAPRSSSDGGGSGTTPFFHQVDEHILKIEKAAGCVLRAARCLHCTRAT